MQARMLIGGMGKGGGAGLLLAAVLFCSGWFAPSAQGAAPPADSPEEQAFRFAFNLFRGEHYPLAETNFSNFLAKYTNSTHRADAVLYLARARLGQSNYTGAIDLLQTSSAGAGKLQSEYVF